MKKLLFYESLLLMQCIFWGVGNPITKIGLEVVPPLLCLSVRYIIAFLIFLLIFAKKVFAEGINGILRHLAAYLIISAFTAASFITSTFAMLYTTATNTGFLMSTAVIFTPFLSYFILKSKIDRKHILSIAIVTAGLFLLCSGNKGFAFGPGEVLALSCAVTGAFTLVYSSKYLQDMDPVAISVMQAGFSGLFCLVFSLIFEGIPDIMDIPLIGWGVIMYLAIGCTCLAYLFQNIALRHLPATFVALSLCSEPIFTAIASYFLLGELLSATKLFGAVLILSSIIMVSLLPEELRNTPCAEAADVCED